ncbi:hypothetical protein D5R81_18545 [Parashewanella spongiae]|uniref:Uncharacterized protein n=1 Tax=Parashewanella spongiae TaxID=342950 RepID=A0A3A6TKF6_9GAMM|nr:hypothetical protein [Parashewanella spongiae]MCL1079264.1 hypothetical protein [Parashewanella spongiae]RJY05345.1 hypothetical protein D5R81_18545 [Parashewanella spongiae]
MNIQDVFQQLETASDFELFRLKCAIDKVLEDPDRSNNLKAKLSLGMKVEYFCPDRNKAILCEVLKVNRTQVNIREIETGKGWNMPFYFLNLDHIETSLQSNMKVGMSKAEIALGDTLGFIRSRDNQECIGTVMKLNPKRVVIHLKDGLWNVPYSQVFPILDSHAVDTQTTGILIEQ